MSRPGLGILLAALLLGVPGWSAPEQAPSFPGSSADSPSFLGGNLTRGLRERDEFNQGRNAAAKGEYRSAVALYENFLRRYPGSSREEQARFELSRSYLELGDYHRALGGFQTSLRKYPTGKYADPMLSTLRELGGQLARKIETREAAQREIAARAEVIRKLIEQGSVSADRYRELGDLSWELARYAEAQAAYQKALELDPDYWKTHDAGERIYFDHRGRLRVRPPTLSDEELLHGLVRVRNYTARVMDLTNDIEGDRRLLLVSGYAVNSATETLHNVELEITLLDLFGNVMDTRALRIGTLRSGQERAFSTRFAGFDDGNVNVFNVGRVKFLAHYE